MRSRHQLLVNFLAIVAVAIQLITAGVAGSAASSTQLATCSGPQDAAHCAAVASDPSLQLSLPEGAQQCPGTADVAACVTSSGPAVQPGTASTPPGQTPCQGDPSSSMTSLAACAEAPASPPEGSIQPVAAVQKLSLRSSHTATQSGSRVVLTAAAPTSVGGSGLAIEIFDTTTRTLVGACSHGSECAVGYASRSGIYDFAAYLTAPTSSMPTGSPVTSDPLTIGWIDLALKTESAAVGPGKPVTVTATSTIPVDQFGYAIEIFDLGTMGRLTYCSHGTNCSVALTQASSGAHTLVAAAGHLTDHFSNPDVSAVSDHLALTWLSVSLTGASTFQVGGTIYLKATTNADLTNTPWSIGILDEKGFMVAPPCKNGSTCTAEAPSASSASPSFSAVVGALPAARTQTKLGQVLQKVSGPPSLVNIQTRSAEVRPSRLLWGVDSCKAFTGDQSGTEVYAAVSRSLGAPDFWGRYLTGTYYCPGLSWPEIYLAARAHMGILPIYNQYNCSDVVGYDTGMAYAQSATSVAAHIGIPQGRVIAIDIEPPGDACPGAAGVNSWFIRGWYDGVHDAGYVPVFYGNGTAGSEFANAWCEAQQAITDMSTTSYIWSFEPSFVSQGWSKSRAPMWQPNATGCPDSVAVWQYQLGSNGPNQDVDGDEALSVLPLWYPTVTGP